MARPLRLLMVTWELQPDSGWGRYSLGLLRGLRQHGVEVVALTARQSSSPDLGIEVVPCLSTPLSPLDRPLAFGWNLLQVQRRARDSDLVHFVVEPYALAASLVFPRPHVITVHGTYGVVPLRGNPATRFLFARAMRRAGVVACVSQFTRDRVHQALPLDNLVVINNGLELPDAYADEGKQHEPIAGDPVLIGVGGLKPRKGYHVVVEALPTVRERYPDVHYYVVGDDRDHKYVDGLRKTIDSLGLEKNVTITGRVDDAYLDALYRRCDVFVLTPVNSGAAFEGFGLTYLEAGAYGKPVLGSYNCGAEDAVRHGENGLLAAQGDADEVAACLLRLLDDRTEAARMGERGREMAFARDWVNVAGEYRALYDRVLTRDEA
ncbi:MAG: glycosyltransferase family 4 protein [Chloroflexota bacterium]|nr:glycosyltransferase family 4 protein [Chloroflexota bacterium]